MDISEAQARYRGWGERGEKVIGPDRNQKCEPEWAFSVGRGASVVPSCRLDGDGILGGGGQTIPPRETGSFLRDHLQGRKPSSGDNLEMFLSGSTRRPKAQQNWAQGQLGQLFTRAARRWCSRRAIGRRSRGVPPRSRPIGRGLSNIHGKDKRAWNISTSSTAPDLAGGGILAVVPWGRRISRWSWYSGARQGSQSSLQPSHPARGGLDGTGSRSHRPQNRSGGAAGGGVQGPRLSLQVIDKASRAGSPSWALPYRGQHSATWWPRWSASIFFSKRVRADNLTCRRSRGRSPYEGLPKSSDALVESSSGIGPVELAEETRAVHRGAARERELHPGGPRHQIQDGPSSRHSRGAPLTTRSASRGHAAPHGCHNQSQPKARGHSLTAQVLETSAGGGGAVVSPARGPRGAC